GSFTVTGGLLGCAAVVPPAARPQTLLRSGASGEAGNAASAPTPCGSEPQGVTAPRGAARGRVVPAAPPPRRARRRLCRPSGAARAWVAPRSTAGCRSPPRPRTRRARRAARLRRSARRARVAAPGAAAAAAAARAGEAPPTAAPAGLREPPRAGRGRRARARARAPARSRARLRDRPRPPCRPPAARAAAPLRLTRPERCPSGRRSATGNRVRAERRVAGSNPALSALARGKPCFPRDARSLTRRVASRRRTRSRPSRPRTAPVRLWGHCRRPARAPHARKGLFRAGDAGDVRGHVLDLGGAETTGEGGHHALPVRDAVDDELVGRLRVVQVRPHRPVAARVGEGVAA